MKRGRPKFTDRTKVVKNTTVHIPLSPDLKGKLATMAENDRRKHSDLVRLLIEDEWERRQKVAAADEVRA
jgi:predicted transcriptional regulator